MIEEMKIGGLFHLVIRLNGIPFSHNKEGHQGLNTIGSKVQVLSIFTNETMDLNEIIYLNEVL